MYAKLWGTHELSQALYDAPVNTKLKCLSVYVCI